MTERGPQNEHPENDLRDDADFANLTPPSPRNYDELADAPDPAHLAQLNRQSSKQAFVYAGLVVLLSHVVGFGALLITRLQGGPRCEAGVANWLCTDSSEIWWPIIASIIPFFGMLGCAVIMVRKLNRYLRWRPWMGMFWILVPHCMFWVLSTIGILSGALA